MSLTSCKLLRWQTLVLFGAALLVRLVIAPFPGFWGDTNCLVQYSRVIAQKGLFSVTEVSASELYPAGYLYHAYVVGHVLKNKLGSADGYAANGMTPGGASVVERMGARTFPIVYDLLAGAVLCVVVGRFVSQKAGEWAAAIFLFNPGVILNAAVWNFDPIPSFYVLVTVIFAGLAFRERKDLFWILAWVTAGMGFCMKLQAGIVVPILAMLTLTTRRPKLVILAPVAFFATVAVVFAPFLLGHQSEYLKKVFVNSFESYPVTNLTAFNLWGLWFQRPVSDRVFGMTYESIGRILFLSSLLWLCWCIWRTASASGERDALRRLAIMFSYTVAAPFVLLTRMHERYLGPAVAIFVLAGLLDRRVRGVMWAFSAAYAVNLLVIFIGYCWLSGVAADLQPAIHVSYCVVRFFCCVTILVSFFWLAGHLPKLLKPVETEGESADPVRTPEAVAAI